MTCSKFINDSIYQVRFEYNDQSDMPKWHPERMMQLCWNKTTLLKLWNYLGLLKRKDSISFEENFIVYCPTKYDSKSFSKLPDWAPDFNKAKPLKEVKWYSSLEFIYTAIETDINQKIFYKFLDFDAVYVQIVFYKKIHMYYEILTSIVKRAKADFLLPEIDEFYECVLKKVEVSND